MKMTKKGSEELMESMIMSITKEKYPNISNNLVMQIIEIASENREEGKVRKSIKKLINDNFE